MSESLLKEICFINTLEENYSLQFLNKPRKIQTRLRSNLFSKNGILSWNYKTSCFQPAPFWIPFERTAGGIVKLGRSSKPIRVFSSLLKFITLKEVTMSLVKGCSHTYWATVAPLVALLMDHWYLQVPFCFLLTRFHVCFSFLLKGRVLENHWSLLTGDFPFGIIEYSFPDATWAW